MRGWKWKMLQDVGCHWLASACAEPQRGIDIDGQMNQKELFNALMREFKLIIMKIPFQFAYRFNTILVVREISFDESFTK